MELTFACPICDAVGRIPAVEDEYLATCPQCAATRELNRAGVADGKLASCLWCATDDLYLQKDFPHGLGLGIVIAGFALSTVFWWMYRPIPAFAVLLITAGLDLALYYLVPDVTICYRCLGQHRGPGSNPESRFAPFDLAIGERYRQERIRIDELKSSQSRPS